MATNNTERIEFPLPTQTNWISESEFKLGFDPNFLDFSTNWVIQAQICTELSNNIKLRIYREFTNQHGLPSKEILYSKQIVQRTSSFNPKMHAAICENGNPAMEWQHLGAGTFCKVFDIIVKKEGSEIQLQYSNTVLSETPASVNFNHPGSFTLVINGVQKHRIFKVTSRNFGPLVSPMETGELKMEDFDILCKIEPAE